jgi:hypothetical protein
MVYAYGDLGSPWATKGAFGASVVSASPLIFEVWSVTTTFDPKAPSTRWSSPFGRNLGDDLL